MSPDTFLILAILIGSLAIIYFSLNKKISQDKQDPVLTEWLKSLQGSIDLSNRNINTTLQQSYREIYHRLDKTTEIMGELKKEAGSFSEIGRSMRDLQQFLQSPKLRGNIGESVLKDLISQIFPKNSFDLQYSFKTGSIVDVAIKTDAGILPIDSKFPMANFLKMVKAKTDKERQTYKAALARDVRKHVRDISSKYILPEENTLDFALMYIPSEPVYYEIVNQPEILDYASRQRVYPVSPTTLYAHLQTILLSFEGKKIATKSKQVFSLLRGVQKDYQKLEDNLNLLNKHLTNAYTQMGNTRQNFTILGQKLASTRTLDDGKEGTE